MTLAHWKMIWTALKRSAAALPAAGAVLGVAMAAGSSVRPDADRTAEAVALNLDRAAEELLPLDRAAQLAAQLGDAAQPGLTSWA